jgi:hypothetical protein
VEHTPVAEHENSIWPETIPDASDWGVKSEDPQECTDLDLRYAFEIFFGREWRHVVQLFGSNPVERTENLRRMPLRPFRYYLRAFVEYIRSEDALDRDNIERSSAASCFLGLIEEKLDERSGFLLSLTTELLTAAEYVAARQQDFDAAPDIFGDFQELLERIRYKALGGQRSTP